MFHENLNDKCIAFDSEDISIARSKCRTQMKVEKLSFTWEIDNVSIHISKMESDESYKLESSKFLTDMQSPFSWYLSIVRCNCEIKEALINLCLCQNLNHTKQIFGKCNYSILGEDANHREGICFETNDDNEVQLYAVTYNDLKEENNRYLKNDTLSIYCEVTFAYDDIKCVNSIWDNYSIDVVREFEDNISQDIAEMYLKRENSDVVFYISYKEYPAHKFILCARSPVFRAMFQHDLKEGREARVNVVDIDCQIFEQMLQYIYTGKLPDKFHSIMVVADLLVAAEKYQLTKLKQACERRMAMDLNIGNAASTLIFADTYKCELLKIAAKKFIKMNIAEVMSTDGDWQNLQQKLLVEICEVLGPC